MLTLLEHFLRKLRKTPGCADPALDPHFTELNDVLGELSTVVKVKDAEMKLEDAEMKLDSLPKKLEKISKGLLKEGRARTPSNFVILACVLFQLKTYVAPGGLFSSSLGSFTFCWGSADAHRSFVRGLKKDMKDLDINRFPDQSPEYTLFVYLKAAVLVLGAHWVLTCRYRETCEATGKDHCCRSTLVYIGMTNHRKDAVHTTSHPGIVYALHQAKK